MDWNDVLRKEVNEEYYANDIAPFLRQEYGQYECYPKKEDIFNAFRTTISPDNVKVVILGQDPYHEPGQAMGLSFSVPKECPNPPSLVNIIKEIQYEYCIDNNTIHYELYDGDLTFLAKQGVLLLNTTLTVRKGEANSHANCGWSTFSDNIIKLLANSKRPIVFMLWGKYAQRKKNLVSVKNDGVDPLVLMTSHPSPFSANRGFMGCNHFTKCNRYLTSHGVSPINWLGEKTYVQ